MHKGITIVGAGNVAWHLAVAFHRAKIKINCIINRTLLHAKELALLVNAEYSSDYSDIPIDTEIVFLCLSDNVIAEVAKSIRAKKYRMVHTSGSLPLSILNENTSRIGVFYPFQTFSKYVNTGELKFPICIEAENTEFRDLLSSIAYRISDKIVFLNSYQRMQLHLGGVIVNNFSNHLIARVFDFLDDENIESELLLPILEETVKKVKLNHPRDVQTGPAVRGNKEIIKKHLDLLKNQTYLYAIYETINSSIEEYYSKEGK